MKLMVLDRDGVINRESREFVKSAEEWLPLPGSIEAIATLSQAGWRIVVASNQSGLARGLFTMGALNTMHAKMHRAVNHAGGRIDAVFYCADGPEADSRFRKPAPGMLTDIAERFNLSMSDVPAIGDSVRDLEAARSAGAQPVLVLTGNGGRTRAAGNLPPGTRVFADLAAVAHAYVT
jgi:D-glycero-D-manno-heptose 1,7-bisphosphate phosphatase